MGDGTRWQALVPSLPLHIPLHIESQAHRISSTFAVPGGLHMYGDYEGKSERMPVPPRGVFAITRISQGHQDHV